MVPFGILDRDNRVERAARVSRDGNDIILPRSQSWSHKGQRHVHIDGVGGKNRIGIKIQDLIEGIVPLEVSRRLAEAKTLTVCATSCWPGFGLKLWKPP